MLGILLYSLWILYTVGSLAVFSLFVSLWLLGRYERRKARKKHLEMMKAVDNDYWEDGGW
jgi:VIT1/CCC1 family predicted Fe2+/Mn2+ transporter